MEPRIQYAKIKDGVSIAYATMGNGVPVVWSFPISHLSYYWESPVWRPWLEGLAKGYQLVMYDARGNGLSQRGLTLTPEALALDLQAVVGRLALDNFFVFAPIGYGHGAIHYAVANPKRIAGLILWACYASGEELDRSIWLRDLAAADWELYLRSIAQTYNWLEPGEVRDYADVLKSSMTQADFLPFFDAALTWDVGPLLSSVRTPALVLHPRELDVVKTESATRLTSMLPNAQLVLLEGARLIPVGELLEPTLAAMAEFIDGIMGRPDDEHDPAPGGLVTILFTDMESSTALTQSLGDAKAQELVRAHNAIVREALGAHGGSEIKHTGDGIMASFTTASGALDCAVAIQQAVAALRQAQGDQAGHEGEAPLAVRIGLNAGEPVAEEGPGGQVDLFGTAVQLARRICDHAQAGEILASNVVRELAAGKNFLFADQGDVIPKGFEQPVRLYEVRWRES